MKHPETLSRNFTLAVVAALIAALFAAPLEAQRPVSYDESLYRGGLEYRLVGPFRGGRSAAVDGVPGQPMVYYFGATGGGVWKTTDAGQTWLNVSDGFFGGSIGAVAVSEWDPNVIYVGGGEKTVRGNVSSGFGMFKSVDAGKTWTAIGLSDSRHISRVRIHPKNPDLVYAAVMGDLYRPGETRGVYRTTDGGITWKRILFANDAAGAVDLVFDPTNPRILYASTWRVRRTPYSLESGGDGSALWKSTDGGETWQELSKKPGFPKGTLGIIGVAVSPVHPERVWAIVEAADGGVFRSEDGGASWRKINDDRNLRQRAWYYTRIYADTQSADTVYVLNVSFWRSRDGGRTYESIRTPHGDHHDLWIAPEDPQRMVIADDGGAQVSNDAGANWTTYHNQPTSQFYRVTTDTHFPYRIYGAQQDNSTIRILHRSSGFGIGENDWEVTAGGESGWLAPDPRDPEIVYGGSYGGLLERRDHRTGQSRMINVWPDNPMGHGAADLKYRFQWNFPILFSRHDPGILYTAGNVLFKTTDEGHSWQAISGDLTRDDRSRMGPSGGLITKDNTSVEYYGTIFALAESALEPGVIWTGSDDGLIQITRDGGAAWTNVTPSASLLPEWAQINSIEADPFEAGGLYVAATRYKSGDFRPYLLRTKDYGRTWTRIDRGIAAEHFTRVVRADPKRKGLLYAGTEAGIYISFDDGLTWTSFQLNLPVVPITDIAVQDDDLIIATQGRSFWMIDDLTPLHALSDEVAASAARLFTPRPATRIPGFGGPATPTTGANAPAGVVIRYFLKDDPGPDAEVRLAVLESDGTVIREFSNRASGRGERIEPRKGMNRFVWNMRYPDAEGFPGLIMWAAGLSGPQAAPGTYQVRLTAGGTTLTAPFEILMNPRASASPADLKAQFEFLIGVRDKVTETHRAVRTIRETRSRIQDVLGRIGDQKDTGDLVRLGREIESRLTAVENELYQTKNQSSQDPLNYPIKLNNRLAALSGVVARGDYPPTQQARAVRAELTALIDTELARLDQIFQEDLAAFNRLAREKDIPAVAVPKR